MKTPFVLLIAFVLSIISIRGQKEEQDTYAEFASWSYIKGNEETGLNRLSVQNSAGKFETKRVIKKYLNIQFPKNKDKDTIPILFPKIRDRCTLPSSRLGIPFAYEFFDLSEPVDTLVMELITESASDAVTKMNPKLASYEVKFKSMQDSIIKLMVLADYKSLHDSLNAEKKWLEEDKKADYLSSIHNRSKVYFIRNFDNKLVIGKHSLVGGAVSIPVKARFRVDTIPTSGVLSVPINLFFGYKYTQVRYKAGTQNEFSIIPLAFFAGVSVEKISKGARYDNKGNEATVPVLNYGLSFQFGYRSFFLGAALGLDHPLDKVLKTQWIYNKRPYIGISLGYKLPFFK